MAFTVTQLQEYIKGDPSLAIENVILAGNSFNPAMGLTIYNDVKYKARRPKITAFDIVLQTGDPSDSTASGGTTFDEIEVEDVLLHVKELYSTYALDEKVTQLAKDMGSDPTDDAYLAIISSLKGRALTLANDKLIWQGDTASSTANLNKFDGVFKIVEGATGANAAIKTGTPFPAAFNAGNAIETVETFMSRLAVQFPEMLTIRTRLFMSPTNFFIYRRALYENDKSIDRDTILAASEITEIKIPGTETYATAVDGMVGLNNKMLLTRPENIYIITDSQTEDSVVTLEYLREAIKWRFLAIYKLGADVVNTNECIIAGA